MSDSKPGLPNDAQYCPSCGEPLASEDVSFFADDTLNAYRASLKCSACNYSGEVIRAGGITDMTVYGDEDGLWCGTHNQYEPVNNACDEAFDPDEVSWLVREDS